MTMAVSILRNLFTVLLLLESPLSLLGDQPNPATAVQDVIRFGNEFFVANRSKPSKVLVEKVKNPNDPNQLDEWRTCSAKGYWFKFYRSKTAPNDLLGSLVITSKDVMLPMGIRVGSTKGSVLERLGPPTSEGRNSISYAIGDVITNSVAFEFRNGFLWRIKWEYEID